MNHVQVFYFCFVFFLSLLIASFVLLVSSLVSKKIKYDHEKMSAFECGFDPMFFSRSPFSFKFFLIGILFLVFDIELAILIPLIKSLYSSNLIDWSMTSVLVIFILLAGIYHEWNQGFLSW